VRELTLRVHAADLETVLDDVLPALPGGLHIQDEGDEAMLSIPLSPGTPPAAELRGLLGARLVGSSEAEASDDWRERRLKRYEPVVIAGRLLIRPAWAPPPDEPDLIEVVLAESASFGTGIHPTTQGCLAALCELEPGGSLADLGCGSGVLSIAAAKLGWSSLVAVDLDQRSVAVAAENASRNGVRLDARRVDLMSEPPPVADTVLANVPPDVHVGLAARLERPPTQAIASGFGPERSDVVVSAWEGLGLRVVDEIRAGEWVVSVLR
jgi:ribosomal protein L11 methyltransferase